MGTAPTDPRPAPRRHLAWAAAIALAAGAVLAAAEWRGQASRTRFEPPAGARFRTASVDGAAEALLVWRASRLRGRRVVVLTGRWSSPRGPAGAAGAGAPPAPLGSGAPGDPLTVHSALYWAARLGVARALDVVMPPAAFERRAAEDAAHKVFSPEDGAYRHDLHGFRLRFSVPRAFSPPGEPALVLVEPSWFAAGAPADPLGWLAGAGVRTDLALVALDDPGATDDQRRAAASYARAAQAPRLELARTP